MARSRFRPAPRRSSAAPLVRVQPVDPEQRQPLPQRLRQVCGSGSSDGLARRERAHVSERALGARRRGETIEESRARPSGPIVSAGCHNRRTVDWVELVVVVLGRDPARRAAVHQRRRVDRRGLRALRGRRGERPGGRRDRAARDPAAADRDPVPAGRSGRRDRDRRHPRRPVHADHAGDVRAGRVAARVLARRTGGGRRLLAEATCRPQDLGYFLVMYVHGRGGRSPVHSRAFRWALAPSCWSRTACTCVRHFKSPGGARAAEPGSRRGRAPLSAGAGGIACGGRRAAPGDPPTVGRDHADGAGARAHRGRGQGVRGRHRRAGQDLRRAQLACSRCWWRPSPRSCPRSSTA